MESNTNWMMVFVCAKEVIVYHECVETVYDTTVYYRDTNASCKCRQSFDGHEYWENGGLHHTVKLFGVDGKWRSNSICIP